MSTRDVFSNISPLDHRYWGANQRLFDRLSAIVSDRAGLGYRVRVELALLRSILELEGPIDPKIDRALQHLEAVGIDPQEVADEEAKTRHDLRALVNVLKHSVPVSVRHLVHVGATSYDIRDTANSMQMRDGVREVVLPVLIDVERALISLSRREAATRQVGRTHGQFAVPITFGFAMAEYVSRLGKAIVRLDRTSRDLRGKLAGAVGAYNATGLLTGDPRQLEKSFLDRLGLLPSDHSTQIVEPEHMLLVLVEMNVVFGILANLADDLRNLQRSEIDEVREAFGASQVGSSTMPQKRNPWNCEHIKSLWKAFSPRVMTFFMDQISEHQRDLTNSASSRFTAEFLAGLVAAANRTLSVLEGLGVDAERMEHNLRSGGDMVLAEAAYVLLSIAGETDAHEVIRRMTLKAREEGTDLAPLLRKDSDTWKKLERVLEGRGAVDPEAFFSDPSTYAGLAEPRALEVADENEVRLAQVEANLAGGSGQ